MWYRDMSQSVSASDARICAASPSTCASESPTCSMPIAAQLSPTVWRQMTVEPDELVDRAVAVDDEMRARAGQLVQLRVRNVGAERVVRRRERRRRGDVLDDRTRLQHGGRMP